MVENKGLNGLDPHDNESSPLVSRIDQLRTLLRARDPYSIASRSGTIYREGSKNRGEFSIAYFGREHKLSWPDLGWSQSDDGKTSSFKLALFLFYLSTSDGASLTGRWVSFADLPEGRMYAPAFQGYTGLDISRKFGLDGDSFELACYRASAQKGVTGDVSFLFQLFPRFHIMAVYWIGDDEFPSVCNLLFDSNAVHYLPIDACAIAGSLVAHRLTIPA
jgi:hypothetical protein